MKVTLASSICVAAIAAYSFAGDSDAGKVVIENPCSFYVQLVGGASFAVDGDFLEPVHGATGDYLGYPLHSGNLRELSFEDIYDDAATYGIRVGRACERSRIYLGFEYTEVGGGSAALGTANVDDCDKTISGDFSNYSDYALILGFERDLFGARGGGKNPVVARRLRPWVGAQVGIRFVDGIDARIQLIDEWGDVVPGSGTTVGVYDDSVVFTAAFTLGLAFDLSDRISIGVESGLRYQTDLDGIDDDLGPMGFGAANENGDLMSVPVLGTVAIKF